MKRAKQLLLCFLFFAALQSCQKKKLTEVVEVPLPQAQEKKMTGNPDDVKAEPGPFKLIKLPYGYDALMPEFDALTMENHYSKHYLGHTNALNRILTGTEMENLPIEDILSRINTDDTDLRNNAGGYYNHSLYFESLAPKAEPRPKDSLSVAIDSDFGSFESFENQFKSEANKQFGSGWTWLVLDKSKKLQITSTQNQDNPLMPNANIKGTPLLGIDLWEHAYYLNYQYKKRDYIEAFIRKIDWLKVSKRYEEAINK